MPRRPRWYILNDDKTVSPVKDLSAWSAWMGSFADDSKRRVGFTDIGRNGHAVEVSTVFLGIDHNFSREGPPLIFETMIFGGEHDGDQWRCSTWEQALQQHEIACGVVRGTISDLRRRPK